MCHGAGMDHPADTAFTPIVGTLSYVWDAARDEVLIIRRNARLDDDHYGKVNGLGGKVEIDEDVVSGARREVREEAGIEATNMSLRGTVTFSDFGPKREQWLVFVFLISAWSGEPVTENNEGSLEWADRSLLLSASAGGEAADRYPMWPGDRHFLGLVFDGDSRTFHGSMPYDADQPVSWSFTRI